MRSDTSHYTVLVIVISITLLPTWTAAFTVEGPRNSCIYRRKQRRQRVSPWLPLHAISHEDDNDNGIRGGGNMEEDDDDSCCPVEAGKLQELKKREAEVAALLASIRREKLSAIQARPLTIGVVGFGRFGQFIAKTFAKYGRVVVTSRSNYTDVAVGMGAKYVPLDDPKAFVDHNLDVIVFAVSIVSFGSVLREMAPYIAEHVTAERSINGDISTTRGPLVVDVLSVKEHARKRMLKILPPECDILCTHPMFGPDSGRNGWQNLNFVYEKTRIDKVILDPAFSGGPHYIIRNKEDHRHHRHHGITTAAGAAAAAGGVVGTFVNETGTVHTVDEDSCAHVEGMDRMERFLSIWEEEGCRMVPMSCRDHDAFAANSQFITHMVGRVLGSQGLSETPIDTSGFQSVLKLIDGTTADSFDLFYGLYKYNKNSVDTIDKMWSAMEDVVQRLKAKEQEELRNNREGANAIEEQHHP